MKRVHPNIPTQEIPCLATSDSCSDAKQGTGVEVLLVWRKSLLFNCSGFTVFNSDGNLAFRVDSYSSRNCGEIVLMDGAGKPLFTSRRKEMSLSFGEQWLVYDGEGSAFPRFAVNKYRSLRHSKTLAKVTRCSAALNCTYEIEGSYAKRSCVRRGTAAVGRDQAEGSRCQRVRLRGRRVLACCLSGDGCDGGDGDRGTARSDVLNLRSRSRSRPTDGVNDSSQSFHQRDHWMATCALNNFVRTELYIELSLFVRTF